MFDVKNPSFFLFCISWWVSYHLLRDRLQNSLLILSELINFYSPLKLSESLRFSDNFRGNGSSLIS